ncbi:MAG: hypothetical protein FD129_1187, partial [bacterium]
MKPRRLPALVAILLLSIPSAPGSSLTPATLTLITVTEEPNSRVIRLKADLGNARSSLEEEAARSPARVVALGSQASLAVNRWLGGCPAIFGFILTPSRLPKPADDSVCFSLTLDPEVRIEALSRLFGAPARFTVLAGPDGAVEAAALAAAGARRHMVIHVIPIRQASEIATALRSIDKNTQALILTTESLFLKEDLVEAILLTTLSRGVPVIGFSEMLVRRGGLASLDINYSDYAAELARE